MGKPVKQSDQEVLLDLTVGAVTSYVSSEDQVETETEKKYETIKTKSVKKENNDSSKHWCIKNVDNNRNFESPKSNDHVYLHEPLFNFRTEYI